MNDPRRLKQMGLLAGLKIQKRDLETRAKICLDEIEASTFVVDSPLNLNGQTIYVAASDLKKVLAEATAIQGRIDELEKALGL